jgi:thiol-disulfide isomerase/thioredoxin
VTKIKILWATLYTLLAVGAILLATQFTGSGVDNSTLNDLRAGDMRKLAIHTKPKTMITEPFLDRDGNEIDLSKYAGKTILLNFWATWCAPCRAEMPSLDALNQTLGGDNFEVVTIATGRNPVPMIEQFFESTDVKSLPMHRDPKMTLARATGVFGLPVTLILNPKGQEIARMQGEADWNSPDAHALLSAIIAGNL